MQLNAGNLVGYILQRTWLNEFADLEFFQNPNLLSDIKISGLVMDNPRNNIFLCKIGTKSAFVFKQPKYFSSGSTWMIYKENHFYSKFQKENTHILPSFYWFDKHYHILALPFLTPYKIPAFSGNFENKRYESEKIATLLAHQLASFHKAIRLNTHEDFSKNAFIRNVISFPPLYQELMSAIRLGYNRPEYYNEHLFGKWRKASSQVKHIYEFIWEDKIYGSLDKFSTSWGQHNKSLIHGDVKIDNILFEGEKLKFIDFEVVTLGDKAWDVACLLDSILQLSCFKFENSISIRKNFFETFITNYLQDIPEQTEVFLERVFKFWALKKIERYKTVMNISEFDFEKEVITVLLNNTNELISDYFESSSSPLCSSFNNIIFNYHSNGSRKNQN